jgi:hypothetical protein
MTGREVWFLLIMLTLGGLFLLERLIAAYNEPAAEAVQPTGTVLATYICDSGFALIYPNKNAQTPICVAYTPAHKI